MAVQVSDFDRFSFTLFMAVALHAIAVLGITFAPELPSSVAQTMEITLSQFDDEQAPEQADFLAQTNQQGSGTENEPLEMTSPQPAEVSQPEVADVQPEPKATTEPQPSQNRAVIETDRARREVAQQNDQVDPEPLPRAKRKSLMERSLEIASLEARLDAQQQAYARKPRVMRVTAASTLKSNNAWYVQDWVGKVTRVGNINYPTEARRAGIYGDLRMLVSIRKDGTIKEVAILQSSGSSVLDDAAIRIVRMAAPFAPFPESMREKADELEIIRTWSFQKRGLSSG
ncbi:MAG: energy transducer TonB [Gammaproteobacteria bacterium]|uniref:Transport protein TonB n=1 Tax=Marinobacter litoralis TaxID=187981 RepID=A0A3M2RDG2_9GAMM|nr:energy transducer TonB [Marinobacter litoralis]MBR9871623.1 energy transducer TonB [Gammaproteobacteria bacterium]RMJ03015.1 transport protein TonB [Marinobacter litoralis]